jgi:uncharacterized membrane protein YqjE
MFRIAAGVMFGVFGVFAVLILLGILVLIAVSVWDTMRYRGAAIRVQSAESKRAAVIQRLQVQGYRGKELVDRAREQLK